MFSRYRLLLLFCTITLLSIIGYYYYFFCIFTSDMNRENYRRECMRLYKKLRYPNASLIFRPPLMMPPADMLNDFEQNGDMPITKSWYMDPSHSANSDNNNNINKQIPELFQVNARISQPLGGYNEKILNEKLFNNYITGKSVAVIGTKIPWIEAIASVLGASKITILNGFEWIHVYDFLDRVLETKELENFDVIMSFSAIEHTGLGRYGDALSPYGDVDAVKQVHCMLKPGGLFLLGLPTSHDGSSYIEFNARRIYGKKRMDLLFKDWSLLEIVKSKDNMHRLYILRK